MYWRKSLIVTVIWLILGFALNTFIYQPLLVNLYRTTASADLVTQVSVAYSLGIGGLVHFILLWIAFRYFSSPIEKAKKKGVLRAEDVVNMLSEQEVAALRDHLLPPSQRTES